MLYVFGLVLLSPVTGYMSPRCFLDFGLFLVVEDTNNFHYDMIIKKYAYACNAGGQINIKFYTNSVKNVEAL